MGSLDRYAPLETALNEAGFKVDEVEKQGKKTVITVTQCGQADENPDFPVPRIIKRQDPAQGVHDLHYRKESMV
jgi:hypothetical protein